MHWIWQRQTLIVAFVLVVAAAWSCGNEQRPNLPSLRGSRGSTLGADTTAALGTGGGERSPEELRKEIEALFAELRQMQSAMAKKEARLDMQARRLRARELELSEREKHVRRLQRTAYGVLGIGLVTLLLALILLIRGHRRAPDAGSSRTPSGSPPVAPAAKTKAPRSRGAGSTAEKASSPKRKTEERPSQGQGPEKQDDPGGHD